ncbi:MAG: hypothetical protein DMF91_24375 [Acidobacteria bacterium]|nr:MAG: hypothetical protein DMF91_24375 [Acidobacteriota bacterium]
MIDLASRRVQIVGSTLFPNELFMRQVTRGLTAAGDGVLRVHRLLIATGSTYEDLERGGIRVVQTPL